LITRTADIFSELVRIESVEQKKLIEKILMAATDADEIFDWYANYQQTQPTHISKFLPSLRDAVRVEGPEFLASWEKAR
jgi:hypothetical protein